MVILMALYIDIKVMVKEEQIRVVIVQSVQSMMNGTGKILGMSLPRTMPEIILTHLAMCPEAFNDIIG